MKNRKRTTSVLLLLCIVIWGTIGWRVFNNLNDSPVPVAQVAKSVMEIKKDSISLLLNYRDPFLGDYLMEDSSRAEVVQEVVYVNPEPDLGFEQEVTPDFQFKGTIRIGKTSQAIVTRQDENILLNVRDKIGEFVVLDISENILTVSRTGKKYQLSIE